jgi:hypothetical protein
LALAIWKIKGMQRIARSRYTGEVPGHTRHIHLTWTRSYAFV